MQLVAAGLVSFSVFFTVACGRGLNLEGDPEGGGGSSGSATNSVCDGTSAVRIHSFNDEGLRDIVSANTLIITGDCKFWVLGGSWPEARTGTLSAAEGRRLSKELFYGTWGDLAGYNAGSFTIVEGGGSYSVYDGTAGVSCGADACGAVNPRWREIFERLDTLNDELYARGRAVAGPMRVTLVATESEHCAEPGAIDWPLSGWDSRFVFEDPAARGTLLTFVDAPQDLVKLRELRTSAKNSIENYGYVVMRAEGLEPDGHAPTTCYDVYARDVLPFEGETGELPFP